MHSGAIVRRRLHNQRLRGIRWLLELTGPPGACRLNAHRYRQLGLDKEVFARSRAILTRSLHRDRHLTLKELV